MSNNQNTPGKKNQFSPKGTGTTPAASTGLKTTPSLTPEPETIEPTPETPEVIAPETEPTPEIKAESTPDPVAQAIAEANRRQAALETKFQRIDELSKIRRHLRKLGETREDLRLFKFEQGDVSNVATLILRDSTGREFSTNRIVLIEELTDCLEIRLNARIDELQRQALAYNIDF